MKDPVVFLPLMHQPEKPIYRTRDYRMPEMSPQNAAILDSDQKIKNLCDNISALVDEKADMAALIKSIGREKDQLVLELKARLGEKAELTQANERLANELRSCIAEKGELQKQLAAKSGMGIQENDSALFTELKRELGQK
jgi:hypothetical protein